MFMTKPIHPSPNLIIGKPKRIRRTRSQMAEDEAAAQTLALIDYCRALAQKRLARDTPAQKAVATRLLRKWRS
jgi:hypothetical protein